MTEDYTSLKKLTKESARQHLLNALNTELESIGKSLKHYQLEHLITTSLPQDRICKEVRDEMNLDVSSEDLTSASRLNKEQLDAYNIILKTVLEAKSEAFFIDGPGGTGKTFLYKALLAKIRSQGMIALATATSGVAASIMPNGRTAHSRFKIPISNDGKLACNVSKQSGLAKLLKQASLIIWDEASMAKKEAIEALDSMLQDINDNDSLFGGKIVVLGGDFRQVLPVIPKGTKEDSMNSSLIRSYIWPKLHKFKLINNMRARTDLSFSDYLLRVGNGEQPCNASGQIKIPDTLLLKPSKTMEPLHQLINFVFPEFDTYTSNPLSMTDSAILTPKNLEVDEINDIMISKFPGEEHTYLSFDQTEDQSQQGMYIDFLNSVTPAGMPTHRLLPKENCPILMLRNINPSKGLCNGTRLICRNFAANMIVAEIAVGEKKGTTVFIPRIPLQPSDAQLYPVQFTRRQFPIRLCFAMTINKAQGQTLEKVGIYLPQPVFSHGQLYVALSRATAAAKIKIHLEQSNDHVLQNYTNNIVYTELLKEANCSE